MIYLLCIGSCLFIFWVFLFFKYQKNGRSIGNIKGSITEKKYLHPIFFIGFGCIEIFNMDLNHPFMKKMYKVFIELKGESAAKYHQYILLSEQLTYFITLAPISIFLGCLLNEPFLSVLGLVVGFTLVYYLYNEVKVELSRRKKELNSDFPTVLSKLTLLMNAGLVLRDAWKKIAYSNNTLLYKEMQLTSEEMRNGFSDQTAITNFAKRCGTKEIRKFSGIVLQNIQKGNRELIYSLKMLTVESWERKRHDIKRESELAGQKLLIPVGMMFTGILLMIIIPIFTNLY